MTPSPDPAALICLLPAHLYGVVGTELNVYWESVFYTTERLSDFDFDVTSNLPADANARQMSDRWTLTPTLANVGTGTVVFEVKWRCETVLTHTCAVTIREYAPFATPRHLLTIGDSLAASGIWLAELLHLMGDSLTLTGTFSASANDAGDPPTLRTVRHQAKNGRTVAWFWGDYSLLNDAASPFVWEGAFDFDWYLRHNALTLDPGDWIFIHLGTNDVYPYTADADVEAVIATAFGRLDEMIAQMQTCVPGIRIGIGLTIAPAISQDAFGYAQGSKQTRWRYARNRALWVQAQIAHFDGRETEGLYVVPVHAALDVVNNMQQRTERLNARNEKTVLRQFDHLHPARSGMHQEADANYALLVCAEAEMSE